MALTPTEQLRIISGNVKPPETDLLSLILQSSFIHSNEFYDTYKEFDESTYPLADRYRKRIFALIQEIIDGDLSVVRNIMRMWVVILGETGYTIDQVEQATQTQWENFVLDQIDESIEYVAQVKRNEKSEYQNI